MKSNRKIYFHIDSGTSTDQIFTFLDTAQSDNENKIDQLMNDSDTKSIAPERDWTYWQSRQCDCFDTKSKYPCYWRRHHTHTKELETNKKARRKYPNLMEMQCFSTFLR